jgi:hypothetical protein
MVSCCQQSRVRAGCELSVVGPVDQGTVAAPFGNLGHYPAQSVNKETS